MAQRTIWAAGGFSPRRNHGQNKANSILSPARIGLLEIMLAKRFGYIENLPVRNGDPVLSPRPKCFRTNKIGGNKEPRTNIRAHDLERHPKIQEFFDDPVWAGDGMISRLKFQDGFPDLLDVDD
jgi:hypothetical protein